MLVGIVGSQLVCRIPAFRMGRKCFIMGCATGIFLLLFVGFGLQKGFGNAWVRDKIRPKSSFYPADSAGKVLVLGRTTAEERKSELGF